VSTASAILIIGDRDDEHAIAVANAIGDRAAIALLDAASLAAGGWQWDNGLEVRYGDQWIAPARGWLRRLAPPGWHLGVEIGGLRGIEAQAALQLIAAITDADGGIEWLTDYWATMRAENKLVQYRVTTRAGLPVPSARVGTSVEAISGLGTPVVMKPLGLGSYTEQGISYAIHARPVDLDDPSLDGLAAAPFIAQQLVPAARHVRIPTVRGAAWPCTLDATNLPLDWRATAQAHSSWNVSDQDAELADMAARVAASLNLGYTCQDWIIDRVGAAWLVDVNPAGQWLFLPHEVASEVTSAIANWLVGE
jgi:hypothetical protein